MAPTQASAAGILNILCHRLPNPDSEAVLTSEPVYAAGVGAVTVPAGYRSVVIYNTGTKDAEFTWDSTVATSGGTFVVPGKSAYNLTLSTAPDEGTFDTMSIAAGAGGTGAIAANEIVLNFTN